MQRCRIIRSITTGTRYTIEVASIISRDIDTGIYVLSACRDCGARLPCLQSTVEETFIAMRENNTKINRD